MKTILSPNHFNTFYMKKRITLRLKCFVSLGGIFLFLLNLKTFAQDPIYPLLFATPSTLNPAMSGLTEGLAKFNFSHRVRRATEVDNFSTTTFCADYAYRGERYGEKDNIAGGSLVVVSDRAGGMNTLYSFLSGAYEVPLGKKIRYNQLRGGFQLGMIQRTLVEPALLFEDQFDGKGFTRATTEGFPTTTSFNMDIAMGVMWYTTQVIPGNREFNYFAGFNANHINRSKLGMYAFENERATIRYTMMAGVKFRPGNSLLDNRLDFNLNAIYSIHNNSKLLTINPMARLVFFDKGRNMGKEKAGIFVGTCFRLYDSFVSYIGLEYKRTYSFAFAYDLLVSKYKITPSSYGGIQVIFSYNVKPVDFDLYKYSKRDTPLPFPIF